MARKHGKDAMTSSMMVLDTGSSASVFHNQDLLERIGATSKTLRLMTNGGEMRDEKMKTRHDLRAWCDPDSIANIISFTEVVKNI